MPNWKITFELDPIGLFFFSVIGHFRNVGGPSGLLTISHAYSLELGLTVQKIPLNLIIMSIENCTHKK